MIKCASRMLSRNKMEQGHRSEGLWQSGRKGNLIARPVPLAPAQSTAPFLILPAPACERTSQDMSRYAARTHPTDWCCWSGGTSGWAGLRTRAFRACKANRAKNTLASSQPFQDPFIHAIFHAISMRFWCDFVHKTCPSLLRTGF